MLRALILPFLLFTALRGAQDLSRLPAWAQAPAAAEAPPEGADAWVLLQRTEFGYRGAGEIRIRTYRLVRILTERGLEEGAFWRHGLGGKASRLQTLKGWNLRPDGVLTTLDRDWILTYSPDRPGEISRDDVTVAALERVVKGSLVAFESQEILALPLGPQTVITPLGPHPIRTWELERITGGGWFTSGASDQATLYLDARNFAPWLEPPAAGATRIRLERVPPLPASEGGLPDGYDALPRLVVGFKDPALPASEELTTWDGIARGTARRFDQPRLPLQVPGQGEPRGLEALKASHRWMQREFNYRQVYLTPERGWTPTPPAATLRNRYGDCKDLTLFLLNAAREAGFEAWPVLARAGGGHALPTDAPSPYAFDHALAAIRLTAPTGLPSEVETPRGRFLLVDATDRILPLGRLPSLYRGTQVMVCTPEGAQWVPVPAGAARTPRFDVDLDGQVTESLAFQGTLTLLERENALGLRGAALWGGSGALRERLGAWLKLPPGSTWTLEKTPDPLDAGEGYRLDVRIQAPGALRKAGSGWILFQPGLPGAPGPIQKLGRPRAMPVAAGATWEGTWRATLRMGGVLGPLLPRAELQTPFRKATYRSEEIQGGWRLSVEMASQSRRYPWERREEGVREQREDRHRLALFLADILAFEVKL